MIALVCSQCMKIGARVIWIDGKMCVLCGRCESASRGGRA